MDLVYEERKKSTHNNLYWQTDIVQRIMHEKINDHEKRVTDVESEIKNLHEELSHLNNHMTNDNQFLTTKQNARYDDYFNSKIEDRHAERRLENVVLELKEVESRNHQIQIVGDLVDEIKEMLKAAPKQKNNYKRQTLLMFHEALKQHYTKNIFSETQVKALVEVARVCNHSFVTKEQYFKMDDILCECDLDMMPDLE